MKRILMVNLVVALGLSLPALAADETTTSATVAKTAEKKETKKLPFRGSSFTFSNSGNWYAYHNPTYSMSFDFRPRYYIRDDLSLRARLMVDVEMTDSDSTNTVREPILSDLSLDVNYAPAFLKIPVLDINTAVSLRMQFPTSKASQGRSLMFALAPGVSLNRSFNLLKGNWLPSVAVLYGFRAYKYFNEYTTRQVDITCSHPRDISCQQSGSRNTNWRFNNTFSVMLPIYKEKLTFTATVMLFHDIKYGMDETETTLSNGSTLTVPGTEVDMSVATFSIFDITYGVLPWLNLSAGVATFSNTLAQDSSYRFPLFNQNTNFYFDISIPIDKFVEQVQSWAGSEKES